MRNTNTVFGKLLAFKTIQLMTVVSASAFSFQLVGAAQVTVPPVTNSHPRIQITADDVSAIQAAVAATNEPRYSTWLSLKSRADSWSQSTNAFVPYTGDDASLFFDAARADGILSSKLGLAYLIDGNTNYAERAKECLLAWAQATPLPATAFDPLIRTPNSGMDTARGMMGMISAYDSIYNYPGFTTAEKAVVTNWFAAVLPSIQDGIDRWEANNYYYGQEYQNHCVAHSMGYLMIGYALGDQELIQFAVDSPDNPRDLLELLDGTIMMAGDTVVCPSDSLNPPPQDGEIYDRYRHVQSTGLAYSHLSLFELQAMAETLFQNGVDVYSYAGPNGENLEHCFGFYADFLKLADSSIRGGYYTGESYAPAWAVAGYEVANMRYPGNPQIEALLDTVDRTTGADYYDLNMVYPALTHGIEFVRSSASLGEFLGEADGWTAKNTDGISQGGNTISAEALTGDPQLSLFNVADSHSLECLDYEQLVVRMKVESGATGIVQLFWGTSLEDGFSSTRAQGLSLTDNDEYNIYTFNVGVHTNWSGVLDDVRIDPFGGTGNIGKRFWVDYVRLLP